MDKNFTKEQQLVYTMLFTNEVACYELVLSDYAQVEDRDNFIEYILDVLQAGRIEVLTDEMAMDFKRGQVWRLKVRPIKRYTK